MAAVCELWQAHPQWRGAPSARHTGSPREFGPQRALDEPETGLGHHDEQHNPDDVTEQRISKRLEYDDARQIVPEIDGIRPLAAPPHRAARQQRPNCRSRAYQDSD